MSASLVGSEMCIRDRFKAQFRTVSGDFGRSPNAVSGSFGQFRAISKCLEPVSYTHLTLPTICSV
eukprot:2896019-Alexandrium_andersonii.AAC.1